MVKINGGATIWARKTIDSDIFYDKPDVWFKIWFYIVNKVNHKDNERYKRSTGFFQYKIIMHFTGATYDQVKHCLEYLKRAKQIAIQRKTRGILITVVNYDLYQTLDNYYADKSQSRSQSKANQKPIKSHTKDKNVKNVKNKKDITKVISSVGLKPNYALIINYLNKKTGSNFDPKNKSTMELIRARFNEGRTVK
ncbi:hypothetical protein ES695_17855, partial [Candidatus Atribacteria bacterium 1244-E10-H5-B2]